MELEPRTLPTDPVAPAPDLAVQQGPQPTNKVVAASNGAATMSAAIAAAVSMFAGDAIMEVWNYLMPTELHNGATAKLIVSCVIAAATFYATQAAGRAVAYNVLDKPNVPLAPVSPAP